MEEPSVQDVIDLIRQDQEAGLKEASYSMSSVLLLVSELTRLRDRVEELEVVIERMAASARIAEQDCYWAEIVEPVIAALAARDTTTKGTL